MKTKPVTTHQNFYIAAFAALMQAIVLLFVGWFTKGGSPHHVAAIVGTAFIFVATSFVFVARSIRSVEKRITDLESKPK